MKHARNSARIFWICSGLILAVLIGGMLAWRFRPYDSAVTVERLAQETAEYERILVQINTESGESSYYSIDGSQPFASLFAFEAWSAGGDLDPAAEPVLVLRFSEAHLLALYTGGVARAHNGYASFGKRGDCVYSIPDLVLREVLDDIARSGQPHAYGDGTIGPSTFHE